MVQWSRGPDDEQLRPDELLGGLAGRVRPRAAVDQAERNGVAGEELAERGVLRRGAAQKQEAADTGLLKRLGQQPHGPSLARAATEVAVGRRDPHRLLLGPPGGGEPAAVGIGADAAQLAGEQGACALHLHHRNIRFASPREAVTLQQRTPEGIGLGRAEARVSEEVGNGQNAVYGGVSLVAAAPLAW